MGQKSSSPEFGCDFCKKDIDSIRYHCKVCKDFDLCLSCNEKVRKENLKVGTQHDKNHETVRILCHTGKMYKFFDVEQLVRDCLSVIVQYTDIQDIQTILLLNHFFNELIQSLPNLPFFEKNKASLFKIPKTPKPYIGSLKIGVDNEEFTPELASLFPNLVELEFWRCKKFNPESFKLLPNLESLDIFITDPKPLIESLVYLKRIESFSLQHRYTSTKISMNYFEYFSNLQELYIVNGELEVIKRKNEEDEEENKQVNPLRHVNKLVLIRIMGETIEIWDSFFQLFPQLENLELSKTSFPASSLRYLKKLKKVVIRMMKMSPKKKRKGGHNIRYDSSKKKVKENVPKDCNVAFARRQFIFVGI